MNTKTGVIRNNDDMFLSYIDCDGEDIHIPDYGYITKDTKRNLFKRKLLRKIAFKEGNKITFTYKPSSNENIFEVVNVIDIDSGNKLFNYIISKYIKG